MRPFDETTRRNIAARCAAFARLPAAEPAPALKRAAVAITLVGTDEAPAGTALLLTLRAAGLRAHRSQWALPGGRCDEGETSIEAALRELHEELGLELGRNDVLGLLDDYPTRSGYLITPVVVWAATRAGLSPNPAEVAAVYRIALDDIEQPQAFDFVAIPESTRRVIRFRHAGHFIHAPTAALIYQFREVLAGRYPRGRSGAAGVCVEVGYKNRLLRPSLRAQRSNPSRRRKKEWIASSLSLLAMTRMELSF